MSAARVGDAPLEDRAPIQVDAVRDRQGSRAGLVDAAIVALVALAGATAWLVLFNPGFMSNDSASQLLQARRGSLSDWHPPIMAALWMLCDRVVAGPLGMLVLQTAFFWTGLALLAGRLSAPLVLKAAFLLLIGFAPPTLSIAGAIWKDVLLVSFLMMAFGLAGRHKAFWVFALLATLTRHNALPAVAAAILVHVSSSSAPSAAALVRAVAATVAVFAASLGINAALTHRHAHVEQAIAMFDLVGIGVTTGKLPEFHPCFRRDGQPVDREVVLRSYDPRSNLYLVAPDTGLHFCGEPEGTSLIVRQWLAAIAESPPAYLAHRLRVSEHLLGLHDTPGDYMMSSTTYTRERFPDLEPPPPQSSLQESFGRVIFAMKGYGVFRTWIYVVLAVVACAAATSGRRWLPCSIALSGLLYECALFFVAPTEEYRYSYWTVVAALIASTWLAVEACATRSAALHAK